MRAQFTALFLVVLGCAHTLLHYFLSFEAARALYCSIFFFGFQAARAVYSIDSGGSGLRAHFAAWFLRFLGCSRTLLRYF